jgi:hypothetical protein
VRCQGELGSGTLTPSQSPPSSPQTMPNEIAFADNSQLARNKRPPSRITRRVKRAIELIVHEAMPFDQAAREVNFSLRALRLAMNKPHVMAFYKAECEVFRDCRRARNYQRLTEIADDQNNMPAVNAIKALLMDEYEQTNNKQTLASPGVTIRIVNVATQPQHEVHAERTLDVPQDVETQSDQG